MMKKVLILAFMALATVSYAQTGKTINLNRPDATRGTSIMQALQHRESIREYADRDLTDQDLSDLLWAANGFNRPELRTAGTASNQQEIDLYLLRADGAYLYDAHNHKLIQITTEDLRTAAASSQSFAARAPITLLIVADMNRSKSDDERARRMSAYDAGIVSQNISLFCSGCGLATVCRGGMDAQTLTRSLKLSSKHILHLSHPVGYPR